MCFANNFSQSVACLFILLTESFAKHRHFNFDEGEFINFGIVSEKSLTYLRSPRFPHRSFLSLRFIFQSVSLYEVIFLRGVRSMSRLVFFACGCPVVATSFWLKDYSFSTKLSFLLLQKSTDYLCGFVSGLSILIRLSIFLNQYPHCLGYWSLIEFPAVRKCHSL